MVFDISIFCVWILLIGYFGHGDGAQLSITPSIAYVTSGGTTTTTPSTPSYVTIECNAGGLSVDTVYSIYIRRQYLPLAEISISVSGNEQAKLSPGHPNDVTSKSPQLDGNVRSGGSSYLRVRYDQRNVDCRDGVMYHCSVHYKPIGGSTDNRTSAGVPLTVHVLPGNPQIIAYRLENSGVSTVQVPIANWSIIRQNERILVTCEGSIGSTQQPVMEWYRRTYNTAPQRLFESQPSPTIEDGSPNTASICHYARTSRLTYIILAADNGLGVHCEVPATQGGSSYRGVSNEYYFTIDVTSGGGVPRVKHYVIMPVLAIGVYLTCTMINKIYN